MAKIGIGHNFPSKIEVLPTLPLTVAVALLTALTLPPARGSGPTVSLARHKRQYDMWETGSPAYSCSNAMCCNYLNGCYPADCYLPAYACYSAVNYFNPYQRANPPGSTPHFNKRQRTNTGPTNGGRFRQRWRHRGRGGGRRGGWPMNRGRFGGRMGPRQGGGFGGGRGRGGMG